MSPASSSRSQAQAHKRYLYTMLPSKDDDGVVVTDAPRDGVIGGVRARDEDEAEGGEMGWKEQIHRDLKPGVHRDT